MTDGKIDASPEAVAAAHKWLLAVAETDDLPGLKAAAALLSQVATEWDAAIVNRNYYAEERKKAEARADTASRQLAEARALLAKFSLDGHLQSFNDRERFRKEARALLSGETK